MKQVTPQQLKQWQEAGKDFVLIDIREDWERSIFHIGGIHMPMDSLFGRVAEIPRDKEVVLYCEKGIRSVIAIQRLETAGIHNLCNLAGGVKAWKQAL